MNQRIRSVGLLAGLGRPDGCCVECLQPGTVQRHADTGCCCPGQRYGTLPDWRQGVSDQLIEQRRFIVLMFEDIQRLDRSTDLQ